MLRILSTLFLLSAISLAQQPQQQQGAAAEPASLEGKVLNLIGGQGVRKVNLTLYPMGGAPTGDSAKPYGTTTDSDGKFVFEAVEPGRYNLWAERSGFIRQSYGAKHGLSGGTTIALAAGQHLKDISLQLTPQAVLSGKVTDEDGDPLGRTQVRVVQIGYRNGKRQPTSRQNGMSDEEGEFKLSNLPPGRYYVCTGTPARRASFEAARSADRDPAKAKPRESYAPACYPSATDATSAVAIDVSAGQTIAGIDIRLHKSAVVRVKGQLSGAVPGHPYDQVQVSLYPADPAEAVFNFSGGSGSVDKKGDFELSNVHPGSYRLTAMVFQGNPQTLGSQPIQVGHEGEQEMPPHAIDLSGGVLGELRVFVKMAAGEVDGVVHDDNSQPAAGANVTLVPDPPNPDQQQLYHSASTDQNGSFQLKNLAPGNYRVYAWEDLEAGAQFDPDFLKPHSSKSERVTVDENGRAQITLTRISVAAVEEAKAKGK